MCQRFDIDLLDDEDPFEIDEGNRPHLYKHLPCAGGRHVSVGEDDIYDLYLFGEPLFYEAKPDGSADWLMIGEVAGLALLVPLAPPHSPDPTKCRPIGIYQPSRLQVKHYRADRWKQ